MVVCILPVKIWSVFWNSLFSFDILFPELTKTFLETKHQFNEKNGYGCGIYKRLDDSIFRIVGVDTGVGFESLHLPQKKITITVISNVSGGETGRQGSY